MFLVRLRVVTRLSLLQVIRNQYRSTIVKLVGKLEKVDFKHCKAALDINFLQTCQSFHGISRFLQCRVANKSLLRSQACQKCLKHLLLTEVNNKKINLKVLDKELSSVKSQLLPIMNFLDFNHVCNIIISNNEKPILKYNYTHNKELSGFIPGYEVDPARFSHDPKKLFLMS